MALHAAPAVAGAGGTSLLGLVLHAAGRPLVEDFAQAGHVQDLLRPPLLDAAVSHCDREDAVLPQEANNARGNNARANLGSQLGNVRIERRASVLADLCNRTGIALLADANQFGITMLAIAPLVVIRALGDVLNLSAEVLLEDVRGAAVAHSARTRSSLVDVITVLSEQRLDCVLDVVDERFFSAINALGFLRRDGLSYRVGLY